MTGLGQWMQSIPDAIKWVEERSTKRIPQQTRNTQYPPLTSASDDEEARKHIEEMKRFWSFDELYPRIRKITPAFDNMNRVLEAALRTRHKYATYLIWRPYLYKVLHSAPNVMSTLDKPSQQGGKRKAPAKQLAPGSFRPPPPPAPLPHSHELPITADDVVGALAALKACTLWYLTHPVFKDQRRLLPHLYEYSHTIFGILLLFVAAERSSVLNAAFDTAERGPNASASAQSSPYPAASSSSSFAASSASFAGSSASGGGGGGGVGAGGGASMAQIQLGLNQMALAGSLEEYTFLREEIKVSRECFLAWMRDMHVVHPIAAWCWDTLKTVHGL